MEAIPQTVDKIPQTVDKQPMYKRGSLRIEEQHDRIRNRIAIFLPTRNEVACNYAPTFVGVRPDGGSGGTRR
jgi:hypothetical protein